MREMSPDTPFDDMLGRAATVIEQSIRGLASEFGLAVSGCVWNLGQGFVCQGPHRLDLFMLDSAIKVYFTDQELIHYLEAQRSEEIKNLLQSRLAEVHNEALPIPLSLALKRLENRDSPT